MSKFIDITGNRYGMLTVIERLKNAEGGVTVWKCQCDCGNSTEVRGRNLKSGAVKSCGCLRKIAYNKTHGMSQSRIYRVWNSMKVRCENENSSAYKNYGARNIKVCEEWSNSFDSFYEWALSTGYIEGMTIERIDNDKGYSPDNCKWITLSEQAQNRRRNYQITYNGKTQNLSKWCEELNVDYSLAHNRIYKLGWDFEKAVATPCDVSKRNRR